MAQDDEEDQPHSRRVALIALVVVVLLIIGGLYLSRVLHSTGRLEDCLMAGRTNCAPLHP